MPPAVGVVAVLAAAAVLQAVAVEPSPTASGGAAVRTKKLAAFRKAVELLQGLERKVKAEGQAEAKTYEAFEHFCKETTAEKQEAIVKGEDNRAALGAHIASLQSRRESLDTAVQEASARITEAEKAVQEARAQRGKALLVYERNSQDLLQALAALANAIRSLKVSKAPALAQTASLRFAADLADSLGLAWGAEGRRALSLLQAPANGNEVPMEHYDFHSDSILVTLEQLEKNFRAQKEEVDKAEAQSVHDFEMIVQEKTKAVSTSKRRLDEARADKERATAAIQTASQRLSTVQADLADDKKYQGELSLMCANKAKTWTQRKKVRTDELATLAQAVALMKGTVEERLQASTVRLAQQGASVRRAETLAADPEAMEILEMDTEAQEAPALIQEALGAASAVRRLRGSGAPDDGRELIANLLRGDGEKLKSTLLTALASKITADPFAKVKVLLQELIERLLQEASHETNQKAWCDKAQADARQKRQLAAEEVRRLNADSAVLEADHDALSREMADLSAVTAALAAARDQAAEERAAESQQNKAAAEEARSGLQALDLCIGLLGKFYRAAAKEAARPAFDQQGPAADAPDAGFESGEAYRGAQAESGGILAMLEVMKSDFQRTIAETLKAEKQAAEDHEAFLTETGVSLAEKQTAEAAKQRELQDASSRLSETHESLKTHVGIVNSVVKELLELKPVCQDTGMSYAERVSRREDEIKSLNKALCVLGRYAEYGPDAAADAC